MRRRALETERALRGVGRAVASKPRISHGQGGGEPTEMVASDACCCARNGLGIGATDEGTRLTRCKMAGMTTARGPSCDTLTSIHASSFMSPESSFSLLLPLTACRLLGGAPSSTAPDAGLFLSSILTKVVGPGGADREVAICIRKERRGRQVRDEKELKA
jgi:hypothetical protein